MTFTDGEKISATLTNGSTAVVLATAITGSPYSTVTINGSTGQNVVAATTAVTIRTAQGGDIVTQTGTSWNSSMVGYVFTIAQAQTTNAGDGFPYIVNQIFSTSVLALNTSYGGTAIASGSATYTMGQVSLIPTAYQLIPIYRAVERYYRVIKKDKEMADEYSLDADKLYAQLEDDYGWKSTNPTIDDATDVSVVNPNLYINITNSSTNQ
jgi:hypothetical protein